MDDGVTVDTTKPELLPIAFAVTSRIQGTSFGRSLLVLLDSGSTASWMNKKALPKGMQGHMVPESTGSTLAGTFTSKEQVCLNDVVLPEFNSKQVLPKLKCQGLSCGLSLRCDPWT